jgi:hypothetical protein
MRERVVLTERGCFRTHRFGRKSIFMMCICLSTSGTMQTSKATDPGISLEARFKADNDAAMSRMMKGMVVTPSGSVDRDFATMMIAHHQGAIDMARAELLAGSNEQLRRIAQEIVVEQQQEVAAMKLALKDSSTGSPQPTRSGRDSVPLTTSARGQTSPNRK